MRVPKPKKPKPPKPPKEWIVKTEVLLVKDLLAEEDGELSVADLMELTPNDLEFDHMFVTWQGEQNWDSADAYLVFEARRIEENPKYSQGKVKFDKAQEKYESDLKEYEVKLAKYNEIKALVKKMKEEQK